MITPTNLITKFILMTYVCLCVCVGSLSNLCGTFQKFHHYVWFFVWKPKSTLLNQHYTLLKLKLRLFFWLSLSLGVCAVEEKRHFFVCNFFLFFFILFLNEAEWRDYVILSVFTWVESGKFTICDKDVEMITKLYRTKSCQHWEY